MKSLSRVRLCAAPWTAAYQAPPSMGFSRQEYWSGLPFPSPGDLPDPGIKSRSPIFQADALTSEPPGKPYIYNVCIYVCICIYIFIYTYVFIYPYVFIYTYIFIKCAIGAKSLQSCPTLFNPMDCSLPGISVHGILRARILEWVAMSLSRGSSQPRNQTCIFHVSCIGRWVPPGKPFIQCSTFQIVINAKH